MDVPEPGVAVTASDHCRRAEALHRRGVARLQQGDARGAYEEFKEASRLDPNNMELWQKYDETYRSVASELALEHAANAAQAPAPAPQAPAPFEPQDMPPTFTFSRPPRVSVQESLVHDPDAAERARDVEARMFRGHLFITGGWAHDANTRLPKHGERQDGAEGAEARKGFQFVMSNRRIFIVIFGCWLVTWIVVVVHYQVLNKKASGKFGGIAAVLWSVVVIVMMRLVWNCLKSGPVIFLTLPDGLKILCGLVILLSVIWHYASGVDQNKRGSLSNLS